MQDSRHCHDLAIIGTYVYTGLEESFLQRLHIREGKRVDEQLQLCIQERSGIINDRCVDECV